MTRIPLHNMLDTILGFSIRDLVLDTPGELEEFKRMLDEKIKEFEIKKAPVRAKAE